MEPDAARMIVLPAVPSPHQQVWSVLRTLTRRTGDVVVPRLTVEVPALHVRPRQLEAYRALCGFRGVDVPTTFPQVMASGLQVHMLTRREFPLPLFGAVHVRNTIREIQPLRSAKDYRVRVGVLETVRVASGIELAVATCFYEEGTLVWESIATALYRVTGRASAMHTTAPHPPADDSPELATFDASSTIGRRYGRVSRDLNPIHLCRLCGRLFGFPRHIAHGMWSLARCVALLQDDVPAPPFEIAVEFKQPLLLPSRVSLLRSDGTGAVNFALTAHDRSRLHLRGSIRPLSAHSGGPSI